MWIIGIVDNNGATKTVTVLGRIMGVVPVTTRLVANIEVIEEGMARNNRALVHHCGAIGPIGSSLEETMPVLNKLLRRVSLYLLTNNVQGKSRATWNYH